jgi:hypothetical protein
MKDKPHSLVTYVLLLTFLVKGLACAHCERVVVGRAQPTHMMYYVRIVWPCASFLSRTLSHSVAQKTKRAPLSGPHTKIFKRGPDILRQPRGVSRSLKVESNPLEGIYRLPHSFFDSFYIEEDITRYTCVQFTPKVDVQKRVHHSEEYVVTACEDTSYMCFQPDPLSDKPPNFPTQVEAVNI